MSFGYNGSVNDYCCMDANSGTGFVYHHLSAHHPQQPTLPVSLPVSTTSQDIVNAHSNLSAVTSQALSDVIPKPNVLLNGPPPRGLHPAHLSHFAMHDKDVSGRLATFGHERVLQHTQVPLGIPQEKLSSSQITNLVSDIFRTDLQYHTTDPQPAPAPPPPPQTHQAQPPAPQQDQQPTNQDIWQARDTSPIPLKKRKRNRKNKDPQPRKIKPAGTHIPREEIKRRRLNGEEYVTRSGKLVKKKVFKFVDCECRRHCTENLPAEMREKIFTQFHQIGSWYGQTQFIVSSVVVTDVKRKSKKMPDGQEYDSRRQNTRNFFLTNQKIQICKRVFMSTLGITTKRLDYALRVKAIPDTAIATPDRRGRGPSRNKTPQATEERIRAHIGSFPAPSGSKPTNSVAPPVTVTKEEKKLKKSCGTALHLPPDMTITKMYQMYQEQCQMDGVQPASMWVYTKILHQESKFKTAPHRGFASKPQTVVTTTNMSCRCCERSYSILTSGEAPDKIVHMLLKEHHQRLHNASIATTAAAAASSSHSAPRRKKQQQQHQQQQQQQHQQQQHHHHHQAHAQQSGKGGDLKPVPTAMFSHFSLPGGSESNIPFKGL